MKEIKAGLKIEAKVSGVEDVKNLNAVLDGTKGKADGAASGGKALAGSFDGMPSKLNPVAESLRKTGDGMDSVKGKSASAGESLVSFGKTAAAALGVTVALDKVSDGMKKVVDTSQEYAAIRSRMEYAFGGTEAAGQQMEWVKTIAGELGLEVKSAANGYAQLAAATKNINMSTEQTQQVFKGVASAAASMNLSTEETNGVLLALSQIAGKGKVSMEELRGQLGERLSPAMAIAAKSMGVTTAELEKMVEKGIAAEDFLPKFGAAMEEAFKGAESAAAPLNRLKNQLDELMLKLADSGVNDAYNAFLTKIGDSLTWIETQIESLDGALTGAAKDVFENTWNTIQTGLTEIGSMLSGVYGHINSIGGALNSITGSSGEFDLFKTVLDGLNISLGLLSDGIKGISVAFEVAVGGVQKSVANIMNLLSTLTFGDISEGFKQAAAEMAAAADESFARAEQKALAFESSAVAAVKRSQETEKQRFDRLAAEAQTAYEKAAAAAVESAQKAKQAREAAEQAVGTSQEAATRKAAEEADKQAAAAMRAAKSAETAWDKALERAGGSAEAAAAVKKPLADLAAQAEKTADSVGAVGDQAPAAANKVAEAFAKIGVDVDSVTTGISSKAKQAFADFQTASQTAAQHGINDANLIRASFEQMMGKLESRQEFEAFRAQLEVNGQTAKLTQDQIARLNEAAAKGAGAAKTAYDSLSESIKTAIQAKELDALAVKTKSAFEAGVISAAQYDNVLKQVSGRKQELAAKSQQAGAAAEKAHQAASAAAAKQSASVKAVTNDYAALESAVKAAGDTSTLTELSNRARDSYESGAISGRQYEQVVANIAKRTDELRGKTSALGDESEKAFSKASKSVTDYGYRMSQTHGWVKLTTEQMALMRKEFAGFKVGAEAETAIVHMKQWTEQIGNAREAMNALSASQRGGAVSAADLARATAAVEGAADKLGKTQLAEFRAAIDDARRRMENLKAAAQSATAELQAQLDELNGNTEATYAYQYQKQLAELQAKLADAQKMKQSEVAAEYAKQIRLLEQIYQRQKANRQAERAEAANAQNTSARTSGLNPADLARGGSVSVDIAALRRALAERDKGVGEQVISQLEQALKRAT